MSEIDDDIYDVFSSFAQKFGLDAAVDRFKALDLADNDNIQAMRQRYTTGVNAVVGEGGPVIARAKETWYQGAQPNDPSWSQFVASMEEAGRSDQIEDVHKASDTIVGLTPDPSKDAERAKGLVVGFVQSGKTTNFTAVAAKAADLDYRMVIVLAGIHNSLRHQTQTRLEDSLISDERGSRWIPVTKTYQDFDLVKLGEAEKREGKAFDAASLLNTPGKTLMVVVKKNHVVLRKLRDWLSTESAQKELSRSNVLIIDDEADQASVETKTINPLIREIIQLMPRSTYIGYTATPFANVFINPDDSDDLYPRDFIYPLPRPDGYFGPEMLFGRDVLDGSGEDKDGYDMIREIPAEDEFLYRPRNKEEVPTFVPTMTAEMSAAISWFLLATSARWHREGPVDSSMLIHTSFQIEVHSSYLSVIETELNRIREGLNSHDEDVLETLRSQWEFETSKVGGEDWGRTSESFDEILVQLPSVLDDVRVVIENSESTERLDYDDREYNTVIAIGGNTLSRGITLLGLVSSIFLRPSNTYDTLLQMGRWFGFRTGYEDLPRIWTTKQLQRSFRHLALVEHEMRSDMEVYESQSLTPDQAAVRIRTHPTLRITAKMGAAVAARTSYNGARLQVRAYERDNAETLRSNWEAGETLIQGAKRRSTGEEVNGGSILYRNVPVELVFEFLDSYQVIPDQPDVDTDMIKTYIQERLMSDNPQMGQWNVAIRAGERAPRKFAGHEIKFVNRSPLKDSAEGQADFGTLMVPQDLLIDMPEISSKEARELKEAGMKALRWTNEELNDKGLLVLYPIDSASENISQSTARQDKLAAASDILGLAMVFPRANYSESERAKMHTTHMWVDLASVQSTDVEVELAENPEDVDNSAAVYGEKE